MRIRIVNFPISADIKDNLDRIIEVLREASKDELVIFPEGALSGYFPKEDFGQLDFELINKGLQVLQQLSRQQGFFLLVGTLLKKEGSIFNSAVYLTPSAEGEIYNKINLAMLERGRITPGDSLPLFSLGNEPKIIPFGIQLCREIRFPEQWRVLAEKGAQCIIHLNNAADSEDGYQVWKSHLISRAAELQRFVISVNVANQRQKCPTLVVDPEGNILAKILSEELVVRSLKIDLDHVSNWYLDQARRDVVSVRYFGKD